MLKAFLMRTPIYFKMGALLFLILILLIPIGMIDSAIGERRYRQSAVINEISQIWGHAQQMFGPVLILPYRETVETRREDGEILVSTVNGRAFILPDTLAIEGTVDPEIRYRGIFEAIVYRSDLRFQGQFTPPDLAALGIGDAEILWDRALLALGATDLRGTRGALTLTFGGLETRFTPGTTSEVIGGGASAAVGPALTGGWAAGDAIDFAFDLDLAGSGSIRFVPAAKNTRVSLASPWPHPSFHGGWLPTERTVGEAGFEADWTVSWFGRDFPQQWLARDARRDNLEHSTGAAGFGVSLITPIDFYVKSERSVKYAILFVLLIFATVFILEVAVPVRVHLIQYALVGFAMTIFYLLLLALAEVIGFAAGFVAAALVSTAMIALYLGRAMASWARGAQIAGILAGIYGFLYVVLQLEDYALLTGTIGVTVALAAVMYTTRGLDWYGLGRADTGEEAAQTNV